MQPILIPVVEAAIARLDAIADEDAAATAPIDRSRELRNLARDLEGALRRLRTSPRPTTGATPGLSGDDRLWSRRDP
jgi:hypothetical protein